MEEQKDEHTKHISAMEELKKEQANQLEVLTQTFTQQIEKLKAQVTEMTEKIETQLSNIQPLPSASPSYAEVARTPPSSRPSNVQTLTSMGTIPSTINDTLYYTIDTSRVGEEEKSKAQPGAIRKARRGECPSWSRFKSSHTTRIFLTPHRYSKYI
jgi:predicted RecB family nuclease